MTSPDPQYPTEDIQPTRPKWTVGKVIGICVFTMLIVGLAVGVITYAVSRHNFETEQAAKPADTVAAQMDSATTVTAPTKCGDDTIYSLPAIGGTAGVLADGDWVDVKSGEATVDLSATYAPNGQVGDIVVTAKPGTDAKMVKVTSIYVWSAAMSDFKAKLNVTRFKPTELKNSARMKATDLTSFGRDSHLMVCTTTT